MLISWPFIRKYKKYFDHFSHKKSGLVSRSILLFFIRSYVTPFRKLSVMAFITLSSFFHRRLIIFFL